MADSGPLSFPTFDDGDDRRLAERLASSYASMPPAATSQITACTAAVLAAARDEHTATPRVAPTPRRVARWWWGAAAAAVLVVVVSRPWRPGETQLQADSAFVPLVGAEATAAPVGSTTEDANGAVRFDLTLPRGARAVAIVGDFNGWDEDATPMVRERLSGEWSAKVTLPPGRHVYAFVVDGTRWLIDPLAPQVPDAGYGPANALIVDPR